MYHTNSNANNQLAWWPASSALLNFSWTNNSDCFRPTYPKVTISTIRGWPYNTLLLQTEFPVLVRLPCPTLRTHISVPLLTSHSHLISSISLNLFGSHHWKSDRSILTYGTQNLGHYIPETGSLCFLDPFRFKRAARFLAISSFIFHSFLLLQQLVSSHLTSYSLHKGIVIMWVAISCA